MPLHSNLCSFRNTFISPVFLMQMENIVVLESLQVIFTIKSQTQTSQSESYRENNPPLEFFENIVVLESLQVIFTIKSQTQTSQSESYRENNPPLEFFSRISFSNSNCLRSVLSRNCFLSIYLYK